MDGKKCSPASPKRDQSVKMYNIHQFDETILNFPEEIIVEILARLPVKSLLKFRCVCKSWLSIISSSQFVKTHLTVSTNKADLSNSRVLITIPEPRFELKQCSLGSLIFEPLTVASLIDYPHKVVWVECSCNGLVCIQIHPMDIYLWNTSTRVSKKLPSVAVNLKKGFSHLWGFGYDETDDDYKIVGIFGHAFKDGVVRQPIVKIYSLKANSWKRINDFNGSFPLDDSGKFANGKLHYSTSPRIGTKKRLDIVSLDLNSEEYGIVEQPNYGDDPLDFFLGVLGGCICVLCKYETRIDVRVMKEYGIKKSWTKVVSMPYRDDPGMFSYPEPLCMLPNGDILISFETYLVTYDSKEKCFRRLEISNLNLFLEACVYVESLVSP